MKQRKNNKKKSKSKKPLAATSPAVVVSAFKEETQRIFAQLIRYGALNCSLRCPFADWTLRRRLGQRQISSLVGDLYQRGFFCDHQTPEDPFRRLPDYFDLCDDVVMIDMLTGGQDSVSSMDLLAVVKCLLQQVKGAHRKITNSRLTFDMIPNGNHIWFRPILVELCGFDRAVNADPLTSRMSILKAKFLRMTLSHGHLFRRWIDGIQAVQEVMQAPQYSLLEMVRVLHLLESDFNILVGMLWVHRVMDEAERHLLLHQVRARASE